MPEDPPGEPAPNRWEPGPRAAPAWYPDPDDPTRIRHWGGASWDGRWRRRPGWDLCGQDWLESAGGSVHVDTVAEGPAGAAHLPAVASGWWAAAAESGLAASTARSGSGGTGVDGAGPPALLARQAHPVRRARVLSGPRLGTLVVCFLAITAMMAAVVGLTVARPSAYRSAVLADPTFVVQANAACGAQLTPVRIPAPTTPAAGGITGAPWPTPSALRTEAATLGRLSTALEALRLSAAERGPVLGWLSKWRRYGTEEMAWADTLDRAASHVGPAPPSLSGPGSLAARADRFAVQNGLDACTLSTQPVSTSAARPFA
ncbi:MAG: hypothetical protein ACRDY0_05480 [Acidimicrobiales bacterium]